MRRHRDDRATDNELRPLRRPRPPGRAASLTRPPVAASLGPSQYPARRADLAPATSPFRDSSRSAAAAAVHVTKERETGRPEGGRPVSLEVTREARLLAGTLD